MNELSSVSLVDRLKETGDVLMHESVVTEQPVDSAVAEQAAAAFETAATVAPARSVTVSAPAYVLNSDEINGINEGRLVDQDGEGMAVHADYNWAVPGGRALRLERIIKDLPRGRTARFGEILVTVARNAEGRMDWETAIPVAVYLPVCHGCTTEMELLQRTHTRHEFWPLPEETPRRNIVITLRVEYGPTGRVLRQSPIRYMDRVGSLSPHKELVMEKLKPWKITNLPFNAAQTSLLETFLERSVPLTSRRRNFSLSLRERLGELVFQ